MMIFFKLRIKISHFHGFSRQIPRFSNLFPLVLYAILKFLLPVGTVCIRNSPKTHRRVHQAPRSRSSDLGFELWEAGLWKSPRTPRTPELLRTAPPLPSHYKSRPGWGGFQLPDYRKIFILPSSESVPR